LSKWSASRKCLRSHFQEIKGRTPWIELSTNSQIRRKIIFRYAQELSATFPAPALYGPTQQFPEHVVQEILQRLVAPVGLSSQQRFLPAIEQKGAGVAAGLSQALSFAQNRKYFRSVIGLARPIQPASKSDIPAPLYF
jgi:hypothetical protein